MNYNMDTDHSIDAIRPGKAAIYDDLLSDPELRRLHEACCDNHRAKIAELRSQPEFADLMACLDRPEEPR